MLEMLSYLVWVAPGVVFFYQLAEESGIGSVYRPTDTRAAGLLRALALIGTVVSAEAARHGFLTVLENVFS